MINMTTAIATDHLPKRWVVTIARTEIITFEVDARDADEAQANYLYAGDEIPSETAEIEAIEVRPMGDWLATSGPCSNAL